MLQSQASVRRVPGLCEDGGHSNQGRGFCAIHVSSPGLKQCRLTSISGCPITNNANCPTARVDAHGQSSITADDSKYGDIRQLQDLPISLLSKWLRRFKNPHMGAAQVATNAPARGTSPSSTTDSTSSTPTALSMPRPGGTVREPPPV